MTELGHTHTKQISGQLAVDDRKNARRGPACIMDGSRVSYGNGPFTAVRAGSGSRASPVNDHQRTVDRCYKRW